MEKNIMVNEFVNPLTGSKFILEDNSRSNVSIQYPCNISDDIFTGKRFDRFVNKMNEAIFELYIRPTYPQIIEYGGYMHDIETAGKIIDTVGFCLFMWQNHLYPGATDEERQNHPATFYIKDSYVSSIVNLFSKEISKDIQFTFVMLPYNPIPGAPVEAKTTFIDLVLCELGNACKEYIKQRAVMDSSIGDDNYFTLIPKTREDCVDIFFSIMNGIHIALYGMFNTIDAEAQFQFMTDEVKENLRSQYYDNKKKEESLLDTIKQKENEILELKSEISSLNNKIENQSKSIDEEHKSIREHNAALQRKIAKLERQLLATSSGKDNNESDLILNEGIIDDDIMDIDYNKKYVFVGNDNKGFQEQIIKQFPNAVFVDSNINLFAASIDMVVALTNHMSHSIYYDVKEQCKNKGIPFIHCKYSNIELIKELIWNYMN